MSDFSQGGYIPGIPGTAVITPHDGFILSKSMIEHLGLTLLNDNDNEDEE